MNAPHAFSLSLTLSLSHTHKHTYLYVYIYIYITYLQLSIRVNHGFKEQGGRWVIDDNSKCKNIRRTISTCAHRIRCKHTKNYSRHISTCEYAQLDDIIYIDIHVTAIAQSNVYRSQNRTIILNVILTLILLDVVYYSVSFMCTKQPTTLHNNLKQRNKGGRSYIYT